MAAEQEKATTQQELLGRVRRGLDHSSKAIVDHAYYTLKASGPDGIKVQAMCAKFNSAFHPEVIRGDMTKLAAHSLFVEMISGVRAASSAKVDGSVTLEEFRDLHSEYRDTFAASEDFVRFVSLSWDLELPEEIGPAPEPTETLRNLAGNIVLRVTPVEEEEDDEEDDGRLLNLSLPFYMKKAGGSHDFIVKGTRQPYPFRVVLGVADGGPLNTLIDGDYIVASVKNNAPAFQKLQDPALWLVRNPTQRCSTQS